MSSQKEGYFIENINGTKLKKRPCLSGQVADYLKSEIKKGAIRPGESLPSEAELFYRFTVSSTVIREAPACLKHDGVLESKQASRNNTQIYATLIYTLNRP